MSALKVFESNTLLLSMNERVKDYIMLKEQLAGLKASFKEIVQLSDFKGKAADAIKGFYRAQMDVVNAWEDFLEEHITILKGIESAAFQRNLSGNTLVHVPFLEDTLRNAAQKSNQIVSGKEGELKRIFHKIDDIISLKVFSSKEYNYQMHRAEKERKATLDQVYELDQYLVREYQKSEAKVAYAKQLFQQLLECSKKNGVISPINFDSKAYHNSDIYRVKKEEFEKQEETKKKENSSWYKVVGDVLLGIGEGVWNAIVDIFKGLWDLGVELVTDPIGFFNGIGNIVAHPLNTGKYLCDAVVSAFTRDVVNGNSRSRAQFFSYGIVSIVGLKGVDKIGKLGKVGELGAAIKAEGALGKIVETGSKGSLPYNVLKTEKLKEFISRKIEIHYQMRKKQIQQLLGSKLGQAMLDQGVRAIQKARTFSTIKNVLNPKAFNSFFEHTYQAVIKSPLAKTAVAINNVVISNLKKIGDMKVPTRIEVHSVQAANGMNFVNVSTETTPLKEIIRERDVGGGIKGTGNKIDSDIIKKYIREMEGQTGRELPKNQIEKLKEALRNKEYKKMSPIETAKHRAEFDKVKNKVIKEWEENTGQKWPVYNENVISEKTGKIIRKQGDKYDSHHIIENTFGGEHEWWNMHPAKFPNEHQAGIHGTGSPANTLFKGGKK